MFYRVILQILVCLLWHVIVLASSATFNEMVTIMGQIQLIKTDLTHFLCYNDLLYLMWWFSSTKYWQRQVKTVYVISNVECLLHKPAKDNARQVEEVSNNGANYANIVKEIVLCTCPYCWHCACHTHSSYILSTYIHAKVQGSIH